MKIAIDASRTTRADLTGTEHYALQLIRHMIVLNEQRDTPNQITLYFRDAPAPDLFSQSAYVQQRIISFKRLWTHVRFAAAIMQDKPDVTFVPAHTLPFLFPGKAIVTVHDLGYKYFPDAHPGFNRRYLHWTTRYSASRATAIFADSQATSDDLQRFYETDPAKIHVVYPGVDPPKVSELQHVHEKYSLPEQYFVFIGTLQPRKNIARIVQAFDHWQQQQPDNQTGLVLAGGKGWLFDEAWVRDIENVYLPGYIDDADKGTLLGGAIVLVFPTLYEGFGFPVLEAMHAGTPVIASTTSSLPELVGDAGILVNPEDVSAISAAMQQLIENPELSTTLREAGKHQAQQFTWEQAATKALMLLEQTATL
ncbi:MAG: glycosyltransferase family 4 protein [Aggregatilineales bacterium]